MLWTTSNCLKKRTVLLSLCISSFSLFFFMPFNLVPSKSSWFQFSLDFLLLPHLSMYLFSISLFRMIILHLRCLFLGISLSICWHYFIPPSIHSLICLFIHLFRRCLSYQDIHHIIYRPNEFFFCCHSSFPLSSALFCRHS